jgi:hypothetical protein
MKSLIFLFSILAVWLASGFYSFELKRQDAVIDSIQVWEFYRDGGEAFRFIIIHVFLSLILGAILGFALSFLLSKPK